MPGIFGILDFNKDTPYNNYENTIHKMAYPMSHLPNYKLNRKVYSKAAFAALSLNGSCRIFETIHERRPYLILIDGHIYRLNGNPYDSDKNFELGNLLISILLKGHENDFLKVQGNYNIAIYDPTDHRLLVFNDIFGPRKLYYSLKKKTFIFSPEMKGICAVDYASQNIDWKSVADFLNFGYVLGEKTFFDDIKSLSSATSLNLTSSGKHTIAVRKYWHPIYTESQTNLKDSTEKCYSLLKSSIIDKTQTKDKLISPISGGLDSRLILGTLKNNCISENIIPITYGQKFSFEYKNAVKVCKSLNLADHILINILPNSLINKYDISAWLSEGMISIANAHLLLLPQFLGINDGRLLNGIYGGPTNYGAEYFSSKHIINSFNDETAVKDIYSVIALNDIVYSTVLTGEKLPPLQSFAFESINNELLKVKNVSNRFCNQRDAFFIENRMRRCINQSALYRFFWDEHLPLSDYELYFNYLDIPAEIKLGRKLLKSILITFFPDLARIPDANSGLDLYSNTTNFSELKKSFSHRLRHYITKMTAGKVSFYDKKTYAHYPAWFRKHSPTFNFFSQNLLSKEFRDLHLLKPKRLEDLLSSTKRGGVGFHHISRLSTFAVWYNLFFCSNKPPEIKTLLKI